MIPNSPVGCHLSGIKGCSEITRDIVKLTLYNTAPNLSLILSDKLGVMLIKWVWCLGSGVRLTVVSSDSQIRYIQFCIIFYTSVTVI